MTAMGNPEIVHSEIVEEIASMASSRHVSGFATSIVDEK